MRGRTDSTLVSAARDGDVAAYGDLFERYNARVYNYAYGICRDPDDAGDITQEAFVRVFEALPRTEGELSFSAYVYRTAHNVAIDRVRSQSRYAGPDALDLECEPSLRADPEKVALLAEQQERTWRAAFQLPDAQREILTLRELHDLSYQQIAEVVGMPRNTVGVLLSRARLRFKEAFRMTSVDTTRLAEECRSMLPLLSARIDGELAGEERESVDRHLERCAFCRLALEEMTEASASYRALLPLLPPLALRDRVWTQLGDLVSPEEAYAAESGAARPRTTRRTSLGLAAVAGVAAVLATLVWAVAVGDVDPVSETHPPATAERTLEAPGPFPVDAEKTWASDIEKDANDGRTTDRDGDEGAADTAADTEAPATPLQLSPADGSTLKGSNVTLSWEAVDDPSGVRYIVEIAVYDSASGTYVSGQTAQVDGTSLLRTLTSNAERWRVRATDDIGNASAFSPWWGYRRLVLLLPAEPIEPVEPVEPPELY